MHQRWCQVVELCRYSVNGSCLFSYFQWVQLKVTFHICNVPECSTNVGFSHVSCQESDSKLGIGWFLSELRSYYWLKLTDSMIWFWEGAKEYKVRKNWKKLYQNHSLSFKFLRKDFLKLTLLKVYWMDLFWFIGYLHFLEHPKYQSLKQTLIVFARGCNQFKK